MDQDPLLQPSQPPQQPVSPQERPSLSTSGSEQPVASLPARRNPLAAVSKVKISAGIVLALLVIVVGGLTFADFGTNGDEVAIGTEDSTSTSGTEDGAPAGAEADTTQQNTTDAEQSADSDTTSSPDPGGSGSSGGGSDGSTNATGAYDISYTNSCYSPANRTIKRGETIRFVNNSNRDMWPASDTHPAHNIYPEFDAKKDIAPGGTYSFTFTKVGSWKYHDHNRVGCTGTITVQ